MNSLINSLARFWRWYTKPIRFGLRTLLLAVVVFAFLALAAKYVLDFGNQIDSEYATAGVISDVTRFVQSHNGHWPQSWSDLPNGDFAQRRVRMRFDVTVDELLADPSLIQTTIVPASGVYHTYPHAERQLNDLREALVRLHGKKK